ncbi:MAG: hypothetical protein RMN53_15710, partial [Anaerolineae bacterium]|nr:hypothetical protein [Anaerolineae bacterium]
VLLLIALGALLGASAALAQTGGGFDLTWNTVDGGGGTSVGGNVSLTGSIGQPDASAPLSGGGYTLVGGFWGEIRVSRPVYLPLVLR